jgi:hypothetical protein
MIAYAPANADINAKIGGLVWLVIGVMVIGARASLIKLAVLRAAHRDPDLDAQVLVHDVFPSVVSGQYRTLRLSWSRHHRARPRCRSKSLPTAMKGTQ